jgi:hypothetical protein
LRVGLCAQENAETHADGCDALAMQLPEKIE